MKSVVGEFLNGLHQFGMKRINNTRQFNTMSTDKKVSKQKRGSGRDQNKCWDIVPPDSMRKCHTPLLNPLFGLRKGYISSDQLKLNVTVKSNSPFGQNKVDNMRFYWKVLDRNM